MSQPLRADAELSAVGYVPPPRGEDLPCDDGEPMETARHRDQMLLLIDTLREHWAERDDFYVGGNMFLYFSALQAKRNDFRGPDVFVVLDTDRSRERRSWVVWEEGGKAPDVIIELTSESTRRVDHGEKRRVYGHVLRVSEYFIYDPWTAELEGFRLLPGGGYRPVRPEEDGRMRSEALGLDLLVWRGVHADVEAPWLRWCANGGDLIPTPQESAADAGAKAADAEAKAADAEAKAADAEAKAADAEAKAADLAAQLAAYEARFGPLAEEG